MGIALAIAMRLLGDHFAGWQALLLLIAIGALFYGAALLAISGTWRNRLLSLSRQLRKSPI